MPSIKRSAWVMMMMAKYQYLWFPCRHDAICVQPERLFTISEIFMLKMKCWPAHMILLIYFIWLCGMKRLIISDFDTCIFRYHHYHGTRRMLKAVHEMARPPTCAWYDALWRDEWNFIAYINNGCKFILKISSRQGSE